uniref:Uncharacterized protein n=1 Tax=Glossina palpalis gambiensis TaxID=67801 RepID=A0A1B0AUQ9_9MUSC
MIAPINPRYGISCERDSTSSSSFSKLPRRFLANFGAFVGIAPLQGATATLDLLIWKNLLGTEFLYRFLWSYNLDLILENYKSKLQVCAVLNDNEGGVNNDNSNHNNNHNISNSV